MNRSHNLQHSRKGTILPLSFYLREDVLLISRELLGKFLVTRFDGHLTSGMIIETEAYRGPEDRASHAFGNRRTARTEVMFQKGGRAYIYLCYGIHHLFNVVTNVEGTPHAVLIRALQPEDGIETMLDRRGKTVAITSLCAGPGSLARALGLHYRYSGTPLDGDVIWIEDRGVDPLAEDIVASSRIGVDYAGEDAKLPWRFRILPDGHLE
ncbi:MAG: DNA-3-methyladenine glycosylase [FCB group bacterium]|nr:DNA-3-methyladenine glycosylase [FCB group bacterium]